jgi:flagellar motor switch protein FliG
LAGKKLADNKPAWEVFEELSDHEPNRVPRHMTQEGELSIEELEAMLAAKKEEAAKNKPEQKAPAPKKAAPKKAAPKKKAS